MAIGRKIVVMGSMPKEDADLVGAAAEHYGLELSATLRLAGGVLAESGEYPAGVISYLQCNREKISNFFSIQHIDFVDDVPFYQCVGDGAIKPYIYELPISGVFVSPLTEAAAASLVLSIVRSGVALSRRRALEVQVTSDRNQKDRLATIGMELCYENDLPALLEHILAVNREAVYADAGCIYTRDRMVDSELCGTLRLMLCQSDSFETVSEPSPAIKINTDTLAGCAVYTGQFIEVDDVDRIRNDAPFKDDRSFVCSPGYRCKSVLTMPLINLDDEVVGVLQLINRKSDRSITLNSADQVKAHARPFSTDDIGVIRFLSRYAALSIDRISLYNSSDI
jgi:GAF domain-containing protein